MQQFWWRLVIFSAICWLCALRSATACTITTITVSGPGCSWHKTVMDGSQKIELYRCPNDSAITFDITETDQPPASYAWRIENIPVPNQNGKTFTTTFDETGTHEVKGIISCTGGGMYGKRVYSATPFTVTVEPVAGGRVDGGTGDPEDPQSDGISCATGSANTLCEEMYVDDSGGFKAKADEGWRFVGGWVNDAWTSSEEFLKPVTLTARLTPKFIKPFTFAEAAEQRYGFDEFSQQAGISETVWKSVELGQNDPVNVELEADGGLSLGDLHFAVDKGDNACATAVKSGTQLQIAGRRKGDCPMRARYHDEQGAVVDTLNVAVYPKKRWNVAIRSVTPSGFQPLTLDGGKLKTYLNEIVYNQGIFSWENVEVYNSLVIPYEQLGGKDRCVDIGYEQDEADTIIATPDAMISTRETTTIFLVPCIYDHARQTDVPGVEIDKVVFIADSHAQSVLNEIVAHELGHAVFDLKHTCASNDPLAGCASQPYRIDDTQNIMWRYASNPLKDRPRLRFWQWKRIQRSVE